MQPQRQQYIETELIATINLLFWLYYKIYIENSVFLKILEPLYCLH